MEKYFTRTLVEGLIVLFSYGASFSQHKTAVIAAIAAAILMLTMPAKGA